MGPGGLWSVVELDRERLEARKCIYNPGIRPSGSGTEDRTLEMSEAYKSSGAISRRTILPTSFLSI